MDDFGIFLSIWHLTQWSPMLLSELSEAFTQAVFFRAETTLLIVDN